MKIKGKHIKDLINTLQNIYDEYGGHMCDDILVDISGINKLKIIDNFKLPEKWCIIANNRENAEILYDYQNKVPGKTGGWDIHTTSHYNIYFIYDNGQADNSHNKPEDALEITIEQFKKYVLKEE